MTAVVTANCTETYSATKSRAVVAPTTAGVSVGISRKSFENRQLHHSKGSDNVRHHVSYDYAAGVLLYSSGTDKSHNKNLKIKATGMCILVDYSCSFLFLLVNHVQVCKS